MDKIWAKLFSGRLFLTYSAGIAFMYAVWKKILTPEAIAGIITMVFTLYFTRTDRKNGIDNKSQT